MRLLNTATLQLYHFNDDNIPPYAILSHKWEEGEVLYSNIQTPEARKMIGYKKVESCCAQAASDGFEYVWIDTCCIDKTSSAELSEAINSMYRWYQNAAVCYAYLSDVPAHDVNGTLAQSKWFTRGWTLPELLAPEYVVFFGAEWVEIGTKASLKEAISDITGIQISALLLGLGNDHFSIAQKMSWASKRKTTRVEDMAYSLMGIFGINMPLLYGEGEKAFTRLQLEILNTSQDTTIFAWTGRGTSVSAFEERHPGKTNRGLLACSPAEFSGCRGVVSADGEFGSGELVAMTAMGLRLEMRLVEVKSAGASERYLAILDCYTGERKVPDPGLRLAVTLERLNEHQYCRVACETVQTVQLDCMVDSAESLSKPGYKRIVLPDDSSNTIEKRIIYVKEGKRTQQGISLTSDFAITRFSSKGNDFSLRDVHPMDYWCFEDGSTFDAYAHQMGQLWMRPGLRTRHGGAVKYQNSNGEAFVLILGKYPRPWCRIQTNVKNVALARDFQYYLIAAQAIAEPDCADRIRACLPGGKSVCVAIKRKRVAGDVICAVEISVV